MKQAAIISLVLSILLTPISQVIFGEFHLDPQWAEELGISGEVVDGFVVANGLDYLRFFRSPFYYMVQNWHFILTSAVIAFITSVLILRRSNKGSEKK